MSEAAVILRKSDARQCPLHKLPRLPNNPRVAVPGIERRYEGRSEGDFALSDRVRNTQVPAERALAGDLSVANERSERASISFATALVTTLDARDRYTAGHSAAVAIYARDIAERLGFRRINSSSLTCAAWFTTLARSGCPLASWRSREP